MTIKTMKEAENLIYQSYLRAIDHITETDDGKVKRPELTRRLFDSLGSPDVIKNLSWLRVVKEKGQRLGLFPRY